MRSFTAIALALALAAPAAAAAQTWSQEAPGLRYATWTAGAARFNALEVDLCAPGVRVRATRFEERNRTTSSYATLVGAQAAVNGDYYEGANRNPVGVAIGEGETWPNSLLDRFHHGIAFGPGRSQIFTNTNDIATAGWPTQAVGMAPMLVQNGTALVDHGGRCPELVQRTSAGLSEDGTTLYLLTSSASSCADMARALVALDPGTGDQGARVHHGASLDGGGSTGMYVQGRGSVQASARSVANHLGVFATGTGPAEHCPCNEREVERFSGANRFDTAAQVSQRLGPSDPYVVFLVGAAGNVPDALVAGPWAAALGAPILYATGEGPLHADTLAEVRRLRARRADLEAVIVGGETVVSAEAEAGLVAEGLAVRRVAGPSRYATAALLAPEVIALLPASGVRRAFVVSGNDANLVDALGAIPWAGTEPSPILLTTNDALSPETADVLGRLGLDEIVVVGGEGVVTPAVAAELAAYGAVRRESGPNRFATATTLAGLSVSEGGLPGSEVLLARSDVFVDALAAGSLPFPLILTTPDALPVESFAYLQANVERAGILGGTGAVSDAVRGQICRALLRDAGDLAERETPRGDRPRPMSRTLPVETEADAGGGSLDAGGSGGVDAGSSPGADGGSTPRDASTVGGEDAGGSTGGSGGGCAVSGAPAPATPLALALCLGLVIGRRRSR